MVYSNYSDRRYLLRWVEETDPTQLDSACGLPTATLADLYASDVVTANPNWVNLAKLKHALHRHSSDNGTVDAIARLMAYANSLTRLYDDWDRSQLLVDKVSESDILSCTAPTSLCQPLSEQGFTLKDIETAYSNASQLLIISSPRPETDVVRGYVNDVVGSVNPDYCSECKKLSMEFS